MINPNKYNCKFCNDTGWYGDNGPGIEGNSEYAPCDECDRGKDRKNQARAIRVDSPIQQFTDAMHAAAREDRPKDRLDDIDLERLLETLRERVEDLDDSVRVRGEIVFRNNGNTWRWAIAVALCAAEIVRRVQ